MGGVGLCCLLIFVQLTCGYKTLALQMGISGEELVFGAVSRDQRARVSQKKGVFVLKETGVDQTIQLYG